jgi:hypothetical protein
MKVYPHGIGWRIGVCQAHDGPPGFKGGHAEVGLFLERVEQEPDRGTGVWRYRGDHGVRFLGWYAAVATSSCLDLLVMMPDGALSLLWLGLRPVAGMPTLPMTSPSPTPPRISSR